TILLRALRALRALRGESLASPMTVAHFHNPRAMARAALYGAALEAALDPAGFVAAHREIASWPDYAPTPLRALDRTAATLGIEGLFYKDEAERFGLKSFKALGGVCGLPAARRDRRPIGRRAGERGGACRGA